MKTSSAFPLPTYTTQSGECFKIWMEQVLERPGDDLWLYRFSVEHFVPRGTPELDRWQAVNLLVYLKKAAFPSRHDAAGVLQGDVLTRIGECLERATKEVPWPPTIPNLKADWWIVP